MAGHNKYSQIKHQKAKTDAQKSKQFSKFSRLITDEVRKAKGNKDAPGVRTAIERARGVNMPNDSIDRAVKKATEANLTSLDSITYESYGPGGCAIVIEALTSNRNKAAQEVKHILSNHGFELAGIGSATWAFEKTHDGWKPATTVPLEEADAELLNKLVEELEDNDEVQTVFTNAE
jgi:transcriptional/translational regulatory protein YebC/TACO1